MRYDIHYRPDWAYNQACMMPADQGRYIEYSDVAGLIEAIKALLPWAESASYGGPDIEADIEQARTALARFQP